MDRKELELVYRLRKVLSDMNVVEAMELLKSRLGKVKTNAEFLMTMALGIEVLSKIVKRDLPLSIYRIRSLKPLWPFETTRARQVLGWKPAVGVQEGLARTFAAKRTIEKLP